MSRTISPKAKRRRDEIRRRRSATHCRRSFHHRPRPIGRAEIYRESRTLSIWHIVAGKFRPKKSVAVKISSKFFGTRNFVNLPILLAVAELNCGRRIKNHVPWVLALCRRRTIWRPLISYLWQYNSFSHHDGNCCNSMRFATAIDLLNFV